MTEQPVARHETTSVTIAFVVSAELGMTSIALLHLEREFLTATTPNRVPVEDSGRGAGIGLVLSENVQVDLAGMFGDLTTEGIFSLVYRFD